MKPLAVALTLALALTGCSSKESRSQKAYAKYVRQSSIARGKQQAKFQSDKPQMPMTPMPSEPTESTTQGPQSMPSEDSQ